MEQETVLDQFGRLENKIEQLLNTCQQLEKNNNQLLERNRSLEAQLQEKITAEKQFNDMKGIIRSKIDGLMVRLDEFTDSQEGHR